MRVWTDPFDIAASCEQTIPIGFRRDYNLDRHSRRPEKNRTRLRRRVKQYLEEYTQEYTWLMLCVFGEILLNVAASCEQTITNRVTGEIITLIENQGDRRKPDPVEKERKTVFGGIYSEELSEFERTLLDTARCPV